MEAWNALVERFTSVTDRLGMPIDPEIFDIVVALNALNIRTVMSCGGHLDHRGLLMPWIDIEADDPLLAAIRKEYIEILKEAEAMQQEANNLRHTDKEHYKAMQNQVDERYAEMRGVQLRERNIQQRERSKLLPLLEGFYADRNVSFDRRLTLHLFGGSRTRIENQAAADFYTFSDPVTQQRKLAECQEEFSEFGAYLKHIYFSQ
jgi:hypothetical protein